METLEYDEVAFAYEEYRSAEMEVEELIRGQKNLLVIESAIESGMKTGAVENLFSMSTEGLGEKIKGIIKKIMAAIARMVVKARVFFKKLFNLDKSRVKKLRKATFVNHKRRNITQGYEDIALVLELCGEIHDAFMDKEKVDWWETTSTGYSVFANIKSINLLLGKEPVKTYDVMPTEQGWQDLPLIAKACAELLEGSNNMYDRLSEIDAEAFAKNADNGDDESMRASLMMLQNRTSDAFHGIKKYHQALVICYKQIMAYADV